MIEKEQTLTAPPADRVGVLTREFHVRIVNYSPSGCLVETNTRIEAGTIGSLRFVVDGREFVDDVQVVRCQPIEGAGALYHVGARFLWTVSPRKGTLRQLLARSNQVIESAESNTAV